MHRRSIFSILDQSQYVSLCGVLFFLPFSIAGMEIFAGVALTCFIIKKIFRPDFGFLKNRLFVILFVFFLCNGLSVFNSDPYIAKSLKALFAKWLSYISLFVLVSDSFGSTKRIKKAVEVLLISSFIVGVDGLFQKFLLFELFDRRPMIEIAPQVFAMTATFNHYNSLGFYLTMALSLVISLLLFHEIKLSFKIILLLLSGILIVCLFSTYSRGSWLSFVVSLFLMAALAKKTRTLGGILIFFFGVLVLRPSLCERFLLIFAPTGDAHRFILWKAALSMFNENPYFGKGVGTFMDRVKDYTPTHWGGQYAHNCFLQIAAEAGIFAFLTFVGFLGLLISKAFMMFRATNDFVLLGILCSICGFLFHSFFDNGLYCLQLTFLFWFFAGLLYCLSLKKISSES
jgi:putative inorganic carbon (HCO3(-)) transporter